MILTQQAHVVAVDAQTLTLGFANSGARDSFDNGGSPEIVRQAAIDVVGHDWRIETLVDPGGDHVTPPAPTPPPAADQGPDPVPDQAPDWAQAAAAPAEAAAPEPAAPEAETPEAGAPEPAERPIDTARQAITQARPAGREPAPPVDATGGARPDDDDMESSGLAGAQLLHEALGAEVIEEIPHS
jgi:DNA polymerase-3 subunit gamma/tau